MNRADIVNAVKDVRAADSLEQAIELAVAHLVRPAAADEEGWRDAWQRTAQVALAEAEKAAEGPR